jgi:NAD(P)H dehydrogenase (quinone)
MLVNHLIVFAHPNRDSFNGAILEQYESALREEGHSVKVRNLYQLDFQPALSGEEYQASFHGEYEEDVKTEQGFIHWADVLTFIYPVWWAGLPALAKGYMDRVFSFGFAYKLDGEMPIPLLSGKKAAIIFTSGTPEKLYRENGMLNSMKQTVEEGLFDFCGLQVAGHLYFGNVVMASERKHEEMLEIVAAFARRF